MSVGTLGLLGCSFAAPGNSAGSPEGPDGGGTGIGGAECGGSIEIADRISHWRFDEADRLADATAIADAEEMGEINTIRGPTSCGDAIGFGAADQTFLVINDRDEWDAIRSIDLFARYPAGIDDAAILSRDANFENNGNLTLYVTRDVDDTADIIALRVQDSDNTLLRCAPAPGPDTWLHVGINLGGENDAEGVELWVDGAEGLETLDVALFDGSTCGVGTERMTPEGSPDPWTLGVSIENSSGGGFNNASRPLVNGGIDNLRFASQRRDFSAN